MTTLLNPIVALFTRRRYRDSRSRERLRVHYLVERRLADRIRAAGSAEERRAIFATMYDELFRQVPDHPRLAAKDSGGDERGIRWDLAQLAPYLRPGCVFLEIGAGDCELSAVVAERASRAYAVDIAFQRQRPMPPNLTFVLSDGQSIDVPEGSVDVAFSDQLMEHLHPDDAVAQLRNIHRALKPGGAYVCITPNRLYGPSDISAYFDDEARGFHLKEYTLRDLREIFTAAGFPVLHAYVGARGLFLRFPARAIEWIEERLERLPPRLRRRVAGSRVMRAVLGLRVAAIKG